jgi:hypothetical protein
MSYTLDNHHEPSGAGPSSRPLALHRSRRDRSADACDTEVLRVVAWPDPLIDALGFDPRSWYVEQFWLGVVGPTSTWLMRRLAACFDVHPDGFELDVAETARSLGLGDRKGAQSPFRRALARCVRFDLARAVPAGGLAIRRHMPPLPRRHLVRLPDSVQTLHTCWCDASHSDGTWEAERKRSRKLALRLLEIEGDADSVELRLLRWRVHPALAHDSARWAVTTMESATGREVDEGGESLLRFPGSVSQAP